MKIVVIGGTGLIGSKTVAILRQGSHEVVAASPNTGVNTITGEGLKETMVGAQVVIDLANSPSFEDKVVLEFFETSGRNLLAAEAAAGVGHHIALSIVGTDRTPDNGYFRAKVAQEKLVESSGIPYTIIRSTQFLEFLRAIADSSADANRIRLSPGLFQPIAADDVAVIVADVALAAPRNGIVEIAGPERAPFNEIVARYLKALGDPREVVSDPEARYWGGRVEEHSLVPLGEARLGRMEALTYPFIKGAAARLGVSLVPLAMDEGGVRPDSVQKAHREAHLSAIYIQPVVQNPLGMTMAPTRRADLLRVVEKLNLPVIEDNVYGFLDDEPPLGALAPESCIVIDSLSKKVAPGLALGFIVPPQWLRESVLTSVRSGGWTASGFAFAAAQRMISDGIVAELSRLKRLDARARQKLAADRLSAFEIQTNEKSYHLWLTLPAHWRSQTFVAAAARRDIALTPSTTFAVTSGHAPNAVRLALAAPTMDQLDIGLRTLAAMLNAREDDFDSTE